jgi:hypothetical protein
MLQSMPITTYLDDAEVAQWKTQIKDPDLINLISELNGLGNRWALRPIPMPERTFLFSRPIAPLYCLYHHFGSIEWQVINFPGGNSSIHVYVEAPLIKAYLLGYLAGRDSARV